MSATDTLLPLGEVTDRLRVVGQTYVGLREIPVNRIVGSVDRAVDFDRFFRPRHRGDLKHRLNALRAAFGDRPMPPISVYEASGLYFVNDGHHRVALARADKADFIDAEVTELRLSHRLHPGVDVQELIHTEQSRRFIEETGLQVSHPEAEIEFSRPYGYAELKEVIEARAYELSADRGRLVPLAEATADWYETCWLEAQKQIDAAQVPHVSWFSRGDIYLWMHKKLRELRICDRRATWADAAAIAARTRTPRQIIESARRDRRKPLPASAPS